MGVYTYELRFPQRPEASDSPKARFTYDFELPAVGSGN